MGPNLPYRLKLMPKMGALSLLLFAVACSPAPVEQGFDDPLEVQNRKIHAFNRSVDRAALRPLATAYGKTAPGPLRRAVGNVSENLSLPSVVLNNLLQFRIEEAGANTFRFLLNSTLGFGGVLDVASDAGITRNSSDFGETLYVWGAREGAYLELPLLGPSTTRAAIGRVVDTATNPLNFVLDGTDRTGTGTVGVLARVDDRYQFRDLVDSILYESEDSYVQARLLYLQNRRFQLTGETQLDDIDPYEDFDDFE